MAGRRVRAFSRREGHGKAGIGCRSSCAGPVSSSRAHRSTRSSPTTTGCRHFSRPPVSRTSKRSCSPCDESWTFASPSPLILAGCGAIERCGAGEKSIRFQYTLVLPPARQRCKRFLASRCVASQIVRLGAELAGHRPIATSPDPHSTTGLGPLITGLEELAFFG